MKCIAFLSLKRVAARLRQQNIAPYLVNLDPAVTTVPYAANIDIRDTVKYKKVMEEYHLGPNGAILTCLNLICTKFNQVRFYPFKMLYLLFIVIPINAGLNGYESKNF